MEKRKAQTAYQWLWLSPLVTIPTALFFYAWVNVIFRRDRRSRLQPPPETGPDRTLEAQPEAIQAPRPFARGRRWLARWKGVP